MNAQEITHLQAVLDRSFNAPHGQKTQVIMDAAKDMGISLPTLQRKLKEVRDACYAVSRKRRNDAGASSLTRTEAVKISACLLETWRGTGKQLGSIEAAVAFLREAGEIKAERVDKKTGEIVPLSPSTVSRALYNYRLHPALLKQATPKTQLATRHPNQLWQIDPSLCVMYYLPATNGQTVQLMDEKAFYKNKPTNIRKVEKERVWRYVITDHTSGVIFVHYVLGAESGKNLVDSFIAAMTPKRPSPFHGVPKMVMVDPGSANTSAVFRNLCQALGVELLVNKPGQPWAKGQVEKSNDIVECSFESMFKIMPNPPSSIEEINELAYTWTHWFNATKVHRRTGRTRYESWMRIKQSELILAPDVELMQQLAHSAPKNRSVNSLLEFEFGGRTYSVKSIPHVMVGDKVEVVKNAWNHTAVQVLYKNQDNKTVLHKLEALDESEYGFKNNAAYIGEEYKAQARTVLEKNADEVERMAMDASTDEEAKASRKRKTAPFGGRVDPIRTMKKELESTPEYIPKRSDEHDVSNQPKIEEPLITCVQAAMQLRRRVKKWQPSYMEWLERRYPDGVKSSQIDALVKHIDQGMAVGLRSVGGEK